MLIISIERGPVRDPKPHSARFRDLIRHKSTPFRAVLDYPRPNRGLPLLQNAWYFTYAEGTTVEVTVNPAILVAVTYKISVSKQFSNF